MSKAVFHNIVATMPFITLNCDPLSFISAWRGHKFLKLSKIDLWMTLTTRIHSSRMHTIRSSSLLRGGCVPALRGVCSQTGSAPSGGACSLGSMLPGGYPSMHWGRPPMNRMTDRCKNITFATLLRTVTKGHSHYMSKAGTEQLC